MTIFRLPFAALLLTLTLAGSPAIADESFTPRQEEEIGRLVREYLLQHPEVIVEAIQELDRRQSAGADQQREQVVAQQAEALGSDPASPVLGNPDGDLLVVEFFDYNCGYCRHMSADLFDLVEADGQIRLVMKELPIFGEGSRFAAKAALASAKQGKYTEFHRALMAAGVQIDQASTLAIAADIGLDVEQLQADMLDPALDAALDRNYELARALQVEGTPAMVIGNSFVPGARKEAEMAQIVAAEREKAAQAQ